MDCADTYTGACIPGSRRQIFLSEENGETKVRILRTKEDADCIIIGNGVKAVMIDAGEAQDGERILEVLQETGLKRWMHLS